MSIDLAKTLSAEIQERLPSLRIIPGKNALMLIDGNSLLMFAIDGAMVKLVPESVITEKSIFRVCYDLANQTELEDFLEAVSEYFR